MKQKLPIPLVVLSLLVALAGPVSAAPPAPGFIITAQKATPTRRCRGSMG